MISGPNSGSGDHGGTPLPLAGIRVLDCSSVLAGPLCTMMLGDLGADVVKVERPGGDDTRQWGPPFWGDPEDGVSAYFSAVNRNKRSIAIDLKVPAGQALLDALASQSHVLVHNFRPSTASRLGLEPKTLHRRHPELIVAAVTGFPDTGPSRDRAAYDLLAQALSGLMSVTGAPEGPPTKVGVALLDLVAGLELTTGILAALLAREPQRSISVSLVEAGVTSLANVLANHLASADEPTRYGNAHPNIAPYQTFPAADGHIVIAVGNDGQFERLLSVLSLTDVDGRFQTNSLRLSRRDELTHWIGSAVRQRTRDDLVKALLDVDVPAGPVLSVPEAVSAMERDYGGNWIVECGGVATPPNPVRINGHHMPTRRPPPPLGADTFDVLNEVGLAASQITELHEQGVVYMRGERAQSPSGRR